MRLFAAAIGIALTGLPLDKTADSAVPASSWGKLPSASVPRTMTEFVTARVERGSVENTITATGALRPVETVEIGSQMAGEIEKLYVDFNDQVHVGDPLAQLDQRTLKAKVDEQRSSLEVARAAVAVQKARLDRASIDLANARAGRAAASAKLESAQALASVADNNLARQKALRATNTVSASALEAAQVDFVSKTAVLKQSSVQMTLDAFAIEGAEVDLRRAEAEFAQAQAELPLREATLRAALIALDRSTIRSPIDGTVVGRFVNQGQTLAEGLEARTVFTIARDLSRMEIHARVDESDIGKLKAGQPATFSVDTYPGRRFTAKVRQVRKAAEVTQNVVTYTVVLTTDNRDGLLMPGMTALAQIVVDRADDVLKVPLAALRFRPDSQVTSEGKGEAGRKTVWVVGADGALRGVAVTTGLSDADKVALMTAPLSSSDSVVVGRAPATAERRILGVRLWF